jgi:hypothetical protein
VQEHERPPEQESEQALWRQGADFRAARKSDFTGLAHLLFGGRKDDRTTTAKWLEEIVNEPGDLNILDSFETAVGGRGRTKKVHPKERGGVASKGDEEGPLPMALAETEADPTTSLAVTLARLTTARKAAAAQQQQQLMQKGQACIQEARYVNALNAFAFGVLDAFSELVKSRYAPACGRAAKEVPIRPAGDFAFGDNKTFCKQTLPCQTGEVSVCQDLNGPTTVKWRPTELSQFASLTHCCCRPPLPRPAHPVGPLLPFVAPPAKYELPFRSCSASRLPEFEQNIYLSIQ